MEDNIVQDWRKASYSGNGGGSCVEVARSSDAVLVRDTKDNEKGPVLGFTRDAWRRALADVRAGRLA